MKISLKCIPSHKEGFTVGVLPHGVHHDHLWGLLVVHHEIPFQKVHHVSGPEIIQNNNIYHTNKHNNLGNAVVHS